MGFLLPITLFSATLCFALGVTLPLLKVSRLYFLKDEPSLVGMITSLFREEEWLMAVIVGLFSIVFPAIKLLLLHIAAYGGSRLMAIPAWFRTLANWSMLDVLLVALVIFAAKTSGLATALTQVGLWFFTASVLLTAAAAALVKRQTSNEA